MKKLFALAGLLFVGYAYSATISTTDLIVKDGQYVDSRAFTSLSAAKDFAYNTGKELQISSSYTITTPITFTCPVRILKGGMLTRSTGGSVIFNSSFEAGLYQVFTDTTGTSFSFGAGSVKEVYPEWWGAIANGVTDSAKAIDSAVQSLSAGTVKIGNGTYILGAVSSASNAEPGRDYICAKSNVNIIGQGESSIIKVKSGQNPSVLWNVIYNATTVSNVIYRDMVIDGNGQNNLLTSGDVPRVNTFIGALGAGTDILIENIHFKNNPGAQTIAYGGTTGGRITVRNCKFEFMGDAIAGNYNTDHTDVYLTGAYNKIIDNYFNSGNTGIFVSGAAFEFHGPDGEAYGNYIYNYKTAAWIALDVTFALRETSIHDNNFSSVWQGPALAPSGTNSFGRVNIVNNFINVPAGGTFTYPLSGTDNANNAVEEYNVIGNKIYSGSAYFAMINTGFADVVNVRNNYLNGVTTYGILVSTGTGKYSPNSSNYINVENNEVRGYTTNGILADSTVKTNSIVIKGNSFISTATIGIVVGADALGGHISDNFVSVGNTHPIFINNAQASHINVNQVAELYRGYEGIIFSRYNAASSNGLNATFSCETMPTLTAPNAAPGDLCTNPTPTIGSPKGFVFNADIGWINIGDL